MSEWEDDDPWGEDPDWAVSDSEQSNSGFGTGNDSGGDGDGDDSNRNRRRKQSSSFGRGDKIPGAQHILILLDCNRTMFQSYIHQTKQNEDEDGDGDGESATRTETESKNLISPIDAALIACQKLLHHRVHNVATTRTGKRDGVGIVLFNCPISTSSLNLNSTSIRRLMELAPPGVEQIQKIRAYNIGTCNPNVGQSQSQSQGQGQGMHSQGSNNSNNDGRMRDLQKELYGRMAKDENENENEDKNESDQEQVLSLRSALFEVNKILSDAKCVKKPTRNEPEDMKTVWVFTNEDDPTGTSICERGREREREREHNEQMEVMQSVCKDLEENEVGLKLWALPKVPSAPDSELPMEVFDKSKFYDYITTFDDEDDEDEDGEDGEDDEEVTGGNGLNLDELLDRFCTTWEKARKFQTIPMFLPDWKEHYKGFDDADANTEADVDTADTHNGAGTESGDKERAYPGIMLDIYQIIKIRKKPLPITIHSRTRK